MDEMRLESFLTAFRDFVAEQWWRDGDDESIVLLGIGNMEEWLREEIKIRFLR